MHLNWIVGTDTPFVTHRKTIVNVEETYRKYTDSIGRDADGLYIQNDGTGAAGRVITGEIDRAAETAR